MALADVKEGDGGAEVNTETAHGIGLSHAVALDYRPPLLSGNGATLGLWGR